jgi:dienelactone hydrolase
MRLSPDIDTLRLPNCDIANPHHSTATSIQQIWLEDTVPTVSKVPFMMERPEVPWRLSMGYLPVATPTDGTPAPSAVIIFITDIFGMKLVNNKLLADKYAADTGCRVLMPDVVPNGGATLNLIDYMDTMNTPIPWYNPLSQARRALAGLQATSVMLPMLVRTWNMPPQLLAYTRAVKGELPEGGRIGVAGFCWGGYQSIELSKKAAVEGGDTPIVDAHFVAHPSGVDVPGALVASSAKFRVPTSVAIGDRDLMVPKTAIPSLEKSLADVFGNDKTLYEVVLYEGCTHGFAVRADPKQEVEDKGAIEAAAQAQRWFRKHLKLDGN